jgi:hypothetical protein
VIRGNIQILEQFSTHYIATYIAHVRSLMYCSVACLSFAPLYMSRIRKRFSRHVQLRTPRAVLVGAIFSISKAIASSSTDKIRLS